MSTFACLKKHSTDLKKANQKVRGLERELKQARAELSNACNTTEVALNQRNQAEQEVAELKKVACGEVY